MALVQKIDSNIVGLSYTEEESPNTLPANPVWYRLEPNSFSDFGATLTTIARNPINPSRQQKKGVVADLDASGGYVTDLTQTNFQDLLQGFLFADVRKKRNPSGTAVTGNTKTYTVDSSAGFAKNVLIFASGFTNPENNGLKIVDSIPNATSIAVTENLRDEVNAKGTITLVGLESLSADMSIDASQDLPALVSKTVDFRQTDLVVGEWIYIGGNGAATRFTNTENCGFKRIKNIADQRLEFDKSMQPMKTEDGAGKTIQVFFGKIYRNELGTKVKRRTYQLERTLGAPDPAQPNQVQSEYITGAVPNTFTLNVPQAEKITLDLSFVATDSEQRTATEGLKAGTRKDTVESSAFNTSSDFHRIKLSEYKPDTATPEPLFTFVTDVSITVNNNVTPQKAVGVLGAFDTAAGTFEVTGELTAYFATIESVRAVRRNADVTFDMIVARENAGFIVDLPLLTLGNAQATIEQNEAIKLPLSLTGATGAKIDPEYNYTIQFMFFDYIPMEE